MARPQNAPPVGVFDTDMKKYIDAHCHLFDTDLPDNIGAIVNATVPAEWVRVIDIANKKPNVRGAIGVHPWYVSDLSDDWATVLRDCLLENPDIMVGEIGLDAHKPNLARQIDVFVRHFNIACELNRGVHIHCVGAWDKVLHILNQNKSKLPPFILFHRFGGKITNLSDFASEYNAYFSFRAPSNAVLSVPTTRLLVETDSADPTTIASIEERIAKIRPECNFYKNTSEMLSNG